MVAPGPQAPRGAPQFTVGRSILYASILVLSVLGLLEGALRVAGVSRGVRPQILLRRIDVDITFPFMRPDRDLLWSLKPGFQGPFLDQRVTINGLGLRGGEVELRRAHGRARIVCFGDSVTFGYGVSDDESYPARLQEALRAKGLDVEVVNAGVTGYTSHQVRGLADRLLPALAPDLVTLAIGRNDASRRPVDDREYVRRVRQTMPLDTLLDRLALYSFLKAAYVRAWVKRLPPRGQTARVPLDHYAENIEAIVARCRETGARPAFIELPRRRRAADSPDRPDAWTYPDAFEAHARRLSVPLLLAGPAGRRGGKADNDSLFIDRLHLSAEGNRVVGQVLAQQIVDLGLLGSITR